MNVDFLQQQKPNEERGNEDLGPLSLNAFDLIILSQGLNLSTLFDRGQVQLARATKISCIISKIHEYPE